MSATKQQVITDLMRMGLSEREAKVYQVLVSVSEITASAIPRYTSISRTKVYEVLDSLIVKVFCKEGSSNSDGQTYCAISPQIALTGLLRNEEDKLNELKKVNHELILFLENIYNTSTDRLKDADFIEVLRGRQEIIHRYTEFRKNVQEEVLEFTKSPFAMTPEEFDLEAEWTEELVRKGVRLRVIYEYSEIDSEWLRYAHKKNMEVGVESRVIDSLPVKMSLFDRRLTMINLKDPIVTGPNLTALVIEHQELYSLLKVAFNYYWDRAKAIGE
ncbi:MAG: helix-turn-helix domain-containing protein [Bacteroidota bacterium]|nr:helix-turn-helix domain-containing protein [Bacteroidota bacterium]